MRLYEHEAKRVFASHGIPVPRSLPVVRSAAELDLGDLPFPVMVKAQALIGGRGKAGGVAKVDDATTAASETERILGLHIGKYPVDSVLIEQAVHFTAQCYVGLTVNPITSNTVYIVSASGGVDIEEVARTRPEAILKLELPTNPTTLPAETATELACFLAKDLGDDGLIDGLVEMLTKLYAVYMVHDCKVVEINPMLITPDGPMAADGKMVMDDNAMYRQGRLLEMLGITSKRHDVAEPTANERRAGVGGFFYVDLHSEDWKPGADEIVVGIVPGGAGYGIFSIDEVSNVGDRFFGGKVVPFNFMDSGGGPSRQRVAEMFHLLMDEPRVDLLITSRFGGISSCDTFVRGLIDALRERHADGRRVLTVHGRMVGTELPAARAYLDAAMVETPEALAPLTMVVGNQQIMADVIKVGLEKHVERSVEVNR